MSYMDLTGRVAIVTGAAQGLGLAIAKRLSTAGATVAVVDINFPGAQEAAHSLIETGGNAAPFECDVADVNSVHGMVEAVLETYGKIDILVNNAGIVGREAPIQEVTDEEWHRKIAVDLTGVFYCCRAVIPYMLERKYGKIINIASMAAKDGNPKQVPYSAAKAGVIGLTKALGKEVARHNIFVNAITPALFETSIMKDLSPEFLKYVTDAIPMGRIGRPEEVGAMVHWLASDEVTFSTGAVFDLSGGRATY